MKENIVSRDLSVHQEHELLQKLENAGMNKGDAQLVIDSKGNSLAANVVDFIRLSKEVELFSKVADLITTLKKNAKETVITVYDRSRQILGDDFISPDEVAEARKSVSYCPEQLRHLEATLPSEEILKWCKANNYAVVAGPPTPRGLLDTWSLNAQLFYSKTQQSSWYWNDNQKFSRDDQASCNWIAIRKDIVPDSTSKNFGKQQKLLSKEEQVPNAVEFSWFVTTYAEVRKVRLFSNVYARTLSVSAFGYHVHLGYFGSDGLYVNGYFWDDSRYDGIGLASSRKFERTLKS